MREGHRRAHRRIWVALSLLLPAILLLGLALRRGGPEEAVPVLLAPPPGPVAPR